jgi:myo-inositol-1(or 4)-monophosphatase
MVYTMTGQEILEALFPTLKLAANYASEIQGKIKPLPEKTEFGSNFYATALTDADLTIQTTLELAILAQFPQIRFFGEEYKKSYNTKYFTATTLGEAEELLITLDPIDGTKPYLDGLPCFSIILTVIKGKYYEAVLMLQPKKEQYIVALRGKGAFVGSLTDSKLTFSQPLQLEPLKSQKIYLSFALADMRSKLASQYDVWCSATDYSADKNPPEYLDLIQGRLAAVLLAKGNLIDNAALGFIAKEAGAIVSLWDGQDFEPFTEVEELKIPGLIVAHNQEIQQKLRNFLS